MKTNTARISATFTLLFLITAHCGLFSESDGNYKIRVEATATAGAGGQPGAAGQTGVAGAAGPSSPDAAATTCTGLPGPAMVEITVANGTKYCIDSTEVTQGQYAEFLKLNTAKPGTEHEQCVDNTSYQPEAVSTAPWESVVCPIDVWTPDVTPNRPVVCVSWCDAYAFCKWAGKRLCGKIGGGPSSYLDGQPAGDPATDANVSQWYYACSQGGKTAYPFGDQFDPRTCYGGELAVAAMDSGSRPQPDVGTLSGCKGNVPPFSELEDMSGSASEYTDECIMRPCACPAGIMVLSCAVRGGSLGSLGSDLKCASYLTAGTHQADSRYGFRCCKDLP